MSPPPFFRRWRIRKPIPKARSGREFVFVRCLNFDRAEPTREDSVLNFRARLPSDVGGVGNVREILERRVGIVMEYTYQVEVKKSNVRAFKTWIDKTIGYWIPRAEELEAITTDSELESEEAGYVNPIWKSPSPIPEPETVSFIDGGGYDDETDEEVQVIDEREFGDPAHVHSGVKINRRSTLSSSSSSGALAPRPTAFSVPTARPTGQIQNQAGTNVLPSLLMKPSHPRPSDGLMTNSAHMTISSTGVPALVMPSQVPSPLSILAAVASSGSSMLSQTPPTVLAPPQPPHSQQTLYHSAPPARPYPHLPHQQTYQSYSHATQVGPIANNPYCFNNMPSSNPLVYPTPPSLIISDESPAASLYALPTPSPPVHRRGLHEDKISQGWIAIPMEDLSGYSPPFEHPSMELRHRS